MNQLIINALKEENTLIIPGFGALTLTNAETGEVMFMSYLKFDDGKLNKLIQEKQGLNQDQAKEAIQNFISEIESSLQKNGSYSFESLGTLIKNKDGELEITFDSTNKGEIQVENKEETLQNVHEDVHEEIQKPKEQYFINENKEINPKVEEVESILKSQEPEKTIDVTKVARHEQKEDTSYTTEDQWKDDLDLPPINHKVEKKKQPILEKTKKDKKKRSPLFYFGLLFGTFIIAGALFIAMFYKSFEKMFPFIGSNNTEETESVIKAKPKEIKKKIETSAKEPQKEKIIETEEEKIEPIEDKSSKKAPSNATNSYYLIVGAFENSTNAEKFQTKLKAEGKDAEIIGPVKGLHLVSAGSYESESEAQKGLSELGGTKGWIYKK